MWNEFRNADIINGDRAGIIVKNGIIYACGVPFSGTSGICKNKKIPLKAIVLLSKGDENRIDRLSPINRFMALLGNFTYNLWDAEQVDTVTSLVKNISKTIPVMHYSCLKDESAVDFLEKELTVI